MKKLPKIYEATILKEINNNKEKCYVSIEQTNNEKKDENEMNVTLDEIFSGLGYSYNIPIRIKTKNKVYDTSLIAKTKKNLITIDNDVISISEVISITKKKN